MGPMYYLRREIESFKGDLGVLEFQVEQIEHMLVGLRGDAERRLWTDFVDHMREEIKRRRSRSWRRPSAAAAGKSESAEIAAALAASPCLPDTIAGAPSHPLSDLPAAGPDPAVPTVDVIVRRPGRVMRAA